MKNITGYFYFAILLVTVTFSSSALADVKVKSRQSVSGQTYENTIYIKGKRQRAEQNTGAMQIVSLTQCDLKRYVQLNPNAKTYIINLFAQTQTEIQNPKSEIQNPNVVRAGGVITSTVTYKNTGEKKKMFGYDAIRVITTMETVSSPDACSPTNSKMEIDGWYIQAAFALDCDYGINAGNYGANRKSGCQDKYQMKTVGSARRGFPVYEKMTFFDQSGKQIMTSVNEVIELSQATLDASLFEIPADYREVKDMTEMYAANTMTSKSALSDNENPAASDSGTISAIKNQAKSNASTEVGAKQAGVIRIGLRRRICHRRFNTRSANL
jgi:hypothetical protein